MGSSPSKAKPSGRPQARQQKKPTKKPSGKKETVIDPTPEYIGSQYYTQDGYEYDARDGFLYDQLHPTSDPFPEEPATYDHSYRSAAAPFQTSNPSRRMPQERPARAVARVTQEERQSWEVDSTIPYSNAPARPVRKIEAKEGHVTDDVIAVQAEPEVRSMSTQTEAPEQSSMASKNLWIEERRVRYRDRSLPHPRHHPLQVRPVGHPALTSYSDYHGDHRSYSSINPKYEHEFSSRHTSLSTYDERKQRPRANHTAVSSLVPERREIVLPPRPQPDADASFYRNERRSRPDANVRFYRNEIRFRPDGVFIDDIHKYWFGDYDRLEDVHTYIQWLFPLPEGSSTNPEAQPLKQNEIEEMVRDSRITKRVLKSYMLMLDFFGIALSNREFGKLQRAENYKTRFWNLNNSGHNYYRITRILKSMGFLGLQHYQLPFVMFLLNEVLVTRQLSNVRDSNLEQWIAAITDNRDREAAMTFYIHHVTHHDKDIPSRGSSHPVQDKIPFPVVDNSDSEEDDVVFDTRYDFEDVDMDNTPKPREIRNTELTELPPISHGRQHVGR